MHVIDANRHLIIANKQSCLPSPIGLYTFHNKQGHENVLLSKTPVFRLVLSPYHVNVGQEGRYLPIYSVLDPNRRICMRFSKSCIGQPHWIWQKMVLHLANSWENYLTGPFVVFPQNFRYLLLKLLVPRM